MYFSIQKSQNSQMLAGPQGVILESHFLCELPYTSGMGRTGELHCIAQKGHFGTPHISSHFFIRKLFGQLIELPWCSYL